MDRRFYHVSDPKNLGPILEKGLLPRIGKHSKIASESCKLVYLFGSKDDLYDALLTWLGELYEDKPILIIELDLDPEKYGIQLRSNEYEWITENRIPPETIADYTVFDKKGYRCSDMHNRTIAKNAGGRFLITQYFG